MADRERPEVSGWLREEAVKAFEELGLGPRMFGPALGEENFDSFPLHIMHLMADYVVDLLRLGQIKWTPTHLNPQWKPEEVFPDWLMEDLEEYFAAFLKSSGDEKKEN